MMIHRESDEREREREITEVERRRSLLMWLIPFSLNDSLVVCAESVVSPFDICPPAKYLFIFLSIISLFFFFVISYQ